MPRSPKNMHKPKVNYPEVPEDEAISLDTDEPKKVPWAQRTNKPSGMCVPYRHWIKHPESGDELGAMIGFAYKKPVNNEVQGVNAFGDIMVAGGNRKVAALATPPQRRAIRSCGRISLKGRDAWVGLRVGGTAVYVAYEGRMHRSNKIDLDTPAPDLALLVKRTKNAGNVLRGVEYYPEIVKWCAALCDAVEAAYAEGSCTSDVWRNRYRTKLEEALKAKCDFVLARQHVKRAPMDFARAAFGAQATRAQLYPRAPTAKHALYMAVVADLDMVVAAELITLAGLCEHGVPVIDDALVAPQMLGNLRTWACAVNPQLLLHKAAASWDLGCLAELIYERGVQVAEKPRAGR